MKEMILTAEVDRLDEVIDFIQEELERHDVPMKLVMQIDIAVEELFVNIAKYAYHPGVGDVSICVDVEPQPPCIVIRFADSGVPYNPLAKQDPDVTLGIEEREIGGLGIYIVKKSMDEVNYSYENGQNILTIRKLL